MKNKIRLTESDLNRIVRKVIKESPLTLGGESDNGGYKEPDKKEQQMVKAFKHSIMYKLGSGGSDWDVSHPNPKLKNLISGIRKVCDNFESMM
jgi:hypothetical protein